MTLPSDETETYFPLKPFEVKRKDHSASSSPVATRNHRNVPVSSTVSMRDESAVKQTDPGRQVVVTRTLSVVVSMTRSSDSGVSRGGFASRPPTARYRPLGARWVNGVYPPVPATGSNRTAVTLSCTGSQTVTCLFEEFW